jgi:transposase
MLWSGISRQQVMEVTALCESAVKKIIQAFNRYGVEGLIAKKRTGRKPVIGNKQKGDIIEELEEPGRAQRTFWTATAFHGHLAEKLRLECSYST